jgi:hypothetical protein
MSDLADRYWNSKGRFQKESERFHTLYGKEFGEKGTKKNAHKRLYNAISFVYQRRYNDGDWIGDIHYVASRELKYCNSYMKRMGMNCEIARDTSHQELELIVDKIILHCLTVENDIALK